MKKILSFLWVKNPMLLYGLSIVTGVMATTSMYSALSVCIALAVMIIPTTVAALLLGTRLKWEIRAMIYTLVASIAFIPAVMAIKAVSPQSVASLTIYLPLLAVNELIVIRADRYAKKRNAGFAVCDLFGCVLSFTLSMLFIAFVRELIGSGSLFGIKLLKSARPEVLLPFMGFIITGFAAALFNRLRELVIVAIRRGRHRKTLRKRHQTA